MLVDGATAGRAVPATLQALASVLPDGWMQDRDGVVAVVTGLPVPTLNGVWALDASVEAPQIVQALRAVQASGAPYCLQARPACRQAAAAAVAELTGAVVEEAGDAGALAAASPDLPLMVLDGPLGAAGAPGLTIRPLSLADSSLHGALAARAFDADAEIFDRVTDPALTLPGTRVYLGEVAGEPVTTALALTAGDAVAVFNVATAPDYRGRGYGAAITGRILNDALAAGASWAWLQARPEVAGIYERLGFRTTESWACWLSG
jgi:ribosomal protein S18 acetylase RimI-like enzyme